VDHGCVGEVAVQAEGDLAHEEVADRVHTVLVDQQVRLHHVLQALAHLLPLDGPPAVGEDLLGQRQACCHEERGPVDGVETEDVLADEVGISWPELREIARFFGIAQGGDVVCQGVEPDVDDVALVARHRDPPGEGRARN